MIVRTFAVPGQPLPAERPRAVARRGKGGKTFVAWITPDRSLAAQAAVRAAYLAEHGHALPLTGDVTLTLDFYRETRRAADVDNLTKTVMDGLNGAAWTDDRQVWRLTVRRILGVPRGHGRTVVTITDESATLEADRYPEGGTP